MAKSKKELVNPSEDSEVGLIEGDESVPYNDWQAYLKAVEEGKEKEPEDIVVMKRPDYEFNVDAALDTVDLTFNGYIPSADAIEFFNIVRLVLGEDPEVDNSLMHYFLVDLVYGNIKRQNYPYSEAIREKIRINDRKIAIIASRYSAKSTVITAYMPIVLAIKGKMPNFGTVMFAVGFGDSQQAGAKVQANTIRDFCADSAFCKEYFEKMRFTDEECEFIRRGDGRLKDRAFMYKVKGAAGGSVRGIRYRTERPQLIFFDDIIKNEADASSPVIMKKLKSMIYSDAENALGVRGKIIAINTPFNKADPIYSALESGVWTPICLPICEKIYLGMPKSEYRSSWPAMHSYEKTIVRYEDAHYGGTLREFNQELMLRISSDDERMVKDDMIQWYDRSRMTRNLANFTIIITTDFTANNSGKGDFSGSAVWAIGADDDKFLLDLELKKRTIQEQYEGLIRLVAKWGKGGRLIEVGIETDGQQQLNLFALKQMMADKNVWFRFARQKGAKEREGIRSKAAGGSKLERFKYMMPSFEMGKIHFPEELRNSLDMKEMLEELKYVSHMAIGCLAGDTKILTPTGYVPIEDIKHGDAVISHNGCTSTVLKVKDPIITGVKQVYTVVTGAGIMHLTECHRVLTMRGYVPVKDLLATDLIIKDDRWLRQSNTQDINGQIEDGAITSQLETSDRNDSGCTATCTHKKWGLSQKVWKYITEMRTKIAIPSVTLNYLVRQTIKSCTSQMMRIGTATNKLLSELLLKKNGKRLGTQKTKIELVSSAGQPFNSKNEIRMIQSSAPVNANTISVCTQQVTPMRHLKKSSASGALKCLCSTPTTTYTVLKHALQQLCKQNTELKLLQSSASTVVKSIPQIDYLVESAVRLNVEKLNATHWTPNANAENVELALWDNLQKLNSAQIAAIVTPLISIEPRAVETVYDFEVEGTNCFLVDGGVVVHNSKHDDGLDLISQLGMIEYILPSMSMEEYEDSELPHASKQYWGKWEHDKEDSGSSVIF